jgi:hypothetical protein
VLPDERDDLKDGVRRDVEGGRDGDRPHVVVQQLLFQLLLLQVEEVDVVEAEAVPVQVAAEVGDDRPEEVGVVEAAPARRAGVETIEQVHTAVRPPLVIHEGEVQVAVSAGVDAHRANHLDVAREVRVVKAND